MIPINGLIWFGLTLVPLVFLQRLLHREIQAVLLILTRSPSLAIYLFSLLFFPGVLLHELSHYVTAVMLGVPAARFSVVPRSLPGGRLQLGYVETARTDIVRDSLVGAAPVIVGGAVVAYLALTKLNLLPLVQELRAGHVATLWSGISQLPQGPGFPLWFYLLFAISSTMLPSQADRHAWLPLAVAAGFLLVIAALAGAGPWMLAHLAQPLDSFLGVTSVVFGLSAAIHAVLLIPIGALHFVLARVTGLDVA